MALTLSQQNYIKTVYELASHGKGARICDIANQLGFSKASACVAMDKLQKYGLVYRDENKLVLLTHEGEHQAVLALDKAAAIQKFLTDAMGVKPEIAERDACTIQHVISMETLCSLCRFTRQKCMQECCIREQTSPESH